MALQLTKPGRDVFAPVTAGGSPRGADLGDAVVLTTEYEKLLEALVADAGGITLLPDIINAVNSGAGTADAIKATASGEMATSAYSQLITVNFTAANTGPMTISINGETPRPLVTNTGQPIPAGYVSAGMSALVQIDGTGNYRLFSYGDAGAIQAIVEALLVSATAEADRAETAAGAVASAPQWAFSSKAAGALFRPAAAPDFINLAGYASPDDLGGANYRKKSAMEADQPGDFTITLADNVTTVRYEIATRPVNQYMFGAVGDGTADDTQALKDMLAFCQAKKAYHLWLAGTHRITDTIQIRSHGDAGAAVVTLDAAAFAAAGKKAAVLVGSRGSNDRTYRLRLTTPAVQNIDREVGDGWAWYESVAGVEVSNLNNCNVFMTQIYGCGVGLRATAFGAGTQANSFHFQEIISNRNNIRIEAGDADCWVNENAFFGGGNGLGGGEDIDAGFRNINLVWPDTASHAAPNANHFYNINLEGIGIRVSVTGTRNSFENCRWEAATAVVTWVSTANHSSASNIIRGGYDADKIEFATVNNGAAVIWNELDTPTKKTFNGDQELFRLAAQSGEAAAITVFASGDDPLTKTIADGSYVGRWAQDVVLLKRKDDAHPRAILDGNASQILFGDGTISPPLVMGAAGNSAFTFSGSLRGADDNTYYLGTSTSSRWAGGYLGTAINVTSDAREKEWRGELTDSERRVARSIAAGIGLYQLTVGPKARQGYHCGSIAQQVEAALVAEGLNPDDYAFLSHDVWKASGPVLDGEGKEVEPAKEDGDRYGLVYEELNQFLLAALFADQADIRVKLEALEAASD